MCEREKKQKIDNDCKSKALKARNKESVAILIDFFSLLPILIEEEHFCYNCYYFFFFTNFLLFQVALQLYVTILKLLQLIKLYFYLYLL